VWAKVRSKQDPIPKGIIPPKRIPLSTDFYSSVNPTLNDKILPYWVISRHAKGGEIEWQ
jgi:hypothetical protein